MPLCPEADRGCCFQSLLLSSKEKPSSLLVRTGPHGHWLYQSGFRMENQSHSVHSGYKGLNTELGVYTTSGTAGRAEFRKSILEDQRSWPWKILARNTYVCNSSSLCQAVAGNLPTDTITTISRRGTPSSLQILPSCEQSSETGQRGWFWEAWFLDREGNSGGRIQSTTPTPKPAPAEGSGPLGLAWAH